MENYFNTNNKKNCNGCGTCSLKCPQNAITMQEDEEGFLYPAIDKEKCINCGLCQKVCSNFNENKKNAKAYIAINKNEDELKISSSGGMFYILAKYTIENDGVVFGVAYDENLVVIHKYACTLDECKQFCGSKYVRSDLKNTYKEAETFLKEGKIVLYTGTACQLSGLKKYLGKEYDNLILCDILCHANPSPKVFKLYKNNIEKKYSKKIKNIKFRSKENGWENSTPVIIFKDNTKIEDKVFYRVFIKELINRPSCNCCVFASEHRISDFTIGDLWGIKKLKPEIDYSKGVSLLLVNSINGKKLLSAIKKDIILEEIEFDCVKKYNHFSNVPAHKNRNKFFYELSNNNINDHNIIKYFNKYAKVSVLKKIKNIIKKVIVKH